MVHRPLVWMLTIALAVTLYASAEEGQTPPGTGNGEKPAGTGDAPAVAPVTAKVAGPVSEAELDAILSGLEARQKEVQGFKADFLNEKESGLVVQIVKSNGKLVFVKPDHFFREVSGDEPVTTVLHNGELLIYFPKDKKAEKYYLKKQDAEGKEVKDGAKEDVQGMLAGLSFERKKLEERFKLNAIREQSGLVRVDLKPLKQDDPMLKYLVRVSLWTDEKSAWPVIVETESPEGDISKDTLSNVQNIKVEDAEKVVKEVFDFKLPRGVKVMTPQK